MKKILFSASILLFTMCTSCDLGLFGKKEPRTELEKLPPITQTGENTFGCLVNGEAFVVNTTIHVSGIYQGGGIQISGIMDDNSSYQNILLVTLDPFVIEKKYDLTNLPNNKVSYRDTKNNYNCWYEFSDTFDGSIIFSKIDRNNHIISGTFEFSTVNDNCDTVRVTDGRFDMQYTP